jgi:uncharacterized phage protein (TIGR02218 family)
MKTLSPALAAHLAEECSTLAYLVRITRSDGIKLGFTSHDMDLTINDLIYRADSAFNPSALVSTTKLSTDNLSINGVLSNDAIAEADLAAGRYDRARCDVYVCNWADLSQGVLQLRRGWLGEVTQHAGRYTAELRGLHDLLQHEFGEHYTAECRHELGDSGCGVNLTALTVNGTVTDSIDARSFVDTAQTAPTGRFNYARLQWLSGANQGLAMEVKAWDVATKTFTLWLPMATIPQIGDSYAVHTGCDKRFVTCRETFSNGVNFGGFPSLPGIDRILNYPDSKV